VTACCRETGLKRERNIAYHLRELFPIAIFTACQCRVEARFPLARLSAELAQFKQPLPPAGECPSILGWSNVGMLLEEAARVLFNNGVQLLARFGERIEWVGYEGWVERGLGEGEDVEQDLGWEGIEMCHHCCDGEVWLLCSVSPLRGLKMKSLWAADGPRG
jgi:hypothetical protein